MNQSSIAPVEPQQPLAVSAPTRFSQRGIIVTTAEELFTFAETVARSGMSPKGLEKPEAVFVAIQMGLEVGLTPMAALQNIAVINGRPAIWGDAQLGVCRASGDMESFEEWFEVDGQRIPRNPNEYTDTTTAVCRVKRRGCEPVEVGFSVMDAKKAGLWGKDGPWRQYPFRMLKARARSYSLRDTFGDTLKGFRSAEEVRDEDPFRDVTPAAGQESKLFLKPEALPATAHTPVAEMLFAKPDKPAVVEPKTRTTRQTVTVGAQAQKPTVTPPPANEEKEPTVQEKVQALCERDQISWESVNAILLRNALTPDTFPSPAETPVDLLNYVVKYWAKIVQLVKGGSK